MYISVLGATITIAMLYLLIPKIGFIGAAWATASAYGSMLILSYVLGRKHYPVPYEVKRIGTYLLICISLSAVSFLYFKGEVLINTVFIILFVILVYLLEQKELRKISINTRHTE